MLKKIRGYGRIYQWLIGASFVAVMSGGVAVPANAQDVGAYIEHIIQCEKLLFSDPAEHHRLCSGGKKLTGPFYSISPTGTGSSPPPEEEKPEKTCCHMPCGMPWGMPWSKPWSRPWGYNPWIRPHLPWMGPPKFF